MRTVWKYEIPVGLGYQVVMPRGAQILPVADVPGGDGGPVAIWACVDPTMPGVARRFVICGTGTDVPDGATWVATGIWHVVPKEADKGALMVQSPLVWHVFEVTS